MKIQVFNNFNMEGGFTYDFYALNANTDIESVML